MKFFYKFTMIAAVFITATVHAAAQKQLSEGSISYNIKIESGSENVSGNLNGAELTVFLKPTISRSELTNSLGVETTVYDSKLNKGFILREYSGQKLMITTTKENWAQKNQWSDNLKFTIENTVTVIGGYNCKKATATASDGKKIEIYFTPDITVANKEYNNSFSDLPGLPVQYEIKSGNLTFKYTLSKVSYDAVPMAKFEAPKTGFRTMTYEESQQLKKGQ